MAQLHTTRSLEAEEAVDLVIDMSLSLNATQFSVKFSETEGVIVNLLGWSGPRKLTYRDFERVLEILDKDPWGPKLKNLRQRINFDEDRYRDIVREAVLDLFPSFEETE